MRSDLRYDMPGPFTADSLPTESRYELVDGNPLWCAPSGDRHAVGTTLGAQILSSDPAVESVGMDAGFELGPKHVRAPDVAIFPGKNQPGWVKGAPSLAIEYADNGQDERELQAKIEEFLARGTQAIWVVRLEGRPRVEVYTPDGLIALVRPGQLLEAPGLLDLPIPMEAFYDRDVAHQVTLRNLLARAGYTGLDDVLQRGWARGLAEGEARGEARGRADGLLAVLAARGFSVSEDRREAIRACTDLAQLESWITRAATAGALDQVF